MAKKGNRSDNPIRSLEELDNEIAWSQYEYADDFFHICDIVPDKDNERLLMENVNEEKIEDPCVYIIVIEKRIFKIGVAAGTKNKGGFAGRLGSYNAGTYKNRISGTASVTNFWVLHSLINLDVNAEVYAYLPKLRRSYILGEMVVVAFPPAKAIEGVIIKKFEQTYGKKPIGNTQR